MAVLPLTEDVRINHLSWRKLTVTLKKEDRNSHQYQEMVHESILHKGPILLQMVEGEVSSGQVIVLGFVMY